MSNRMGLLLIVFSLVFHSCTGKIIVSASVEEFGLNTTLDMLKIKIGFSSNSTNVLNKLKKSEESILLKYKILDTDNSIELGTIAGGISSTDGKIVWTATVGLSDLSSDNYFVRIRDFMDNRNLISSGEILFPATENKELFLLGPQCNVLSKIIYLKKFGSDIYTRVINEKVRTAEAAYSLMPNPKDSAISSKAKYKGKKIYIEGYISGKPIDVLGNVHVNIFTPPVNTFKVGCDFNKSLESEFVGIEDGNYLVVSGDYSGQSGQYILLNNCQILFKTSR